jgi:hypothetical protein
VAGSAIAAVPASAFVLDPPAAGRNISVFHNLDFVAVFGYPDAGALQVDVVRGAHRIGTVSANAIVTPDGPGLEINHGVEGTAGPGDCWTGSTPDIQPGDEIVVRSGADVDRIAVDHITIDGDPQLMPNGDIQVRGTAERANATRDPIPANALDSAEFRLGGFRGAPDSIVATPGTTSGWTAIINPPYDGDLASFRNQGNLSEAQRKEALLGRIHTIGYGHVEVPPAETQLFEGEETPGPAAGCEASAGQSNAVTGTSDAVISQVSGDLVVNGTAMGSVLGATDADPATPVTGATISVDDTDPATPAVTKTVVLPGGDEQQNWTATFTTPETAPLADGPITVAATYTVGATTDLGGRSLTIAKDTTGPAVTGDPAPGSYVSPRAVTLKGAAGDEIRFRTDGDATSGSPKADAPIALPLGATTISWWAKDALGNVSSGALDYELTRAPDPAPAGGTQSGGGGAIAAAASLLPAGPVSLPGLAGAQGVAGIQVSRSMRLATARRLGITVSFLAPRGSRAAEVRLIERRGGVRRRLATRQLPVRGGERVVVRLRDATVRRRLAAGRYEVEIRTGPSPANLGRRITRTVQIAR